MKGDAKAESAREVDNDRIDELYRQPLDMFVAARNALAKTLSGEVAQQVRKLVKPTVVPWAVNQLYWRARATYDRLIDSGATLRQAQIASLEGHKSDLPAASEAHRRAISDAMKESQRLAAESGSHPDPDALMRTLEALSLAVERPSAPGRLTEPLRPAGFEALAGVQPTGLSKAAGSSAASGPGLAGALAAMVGQAPPHSPAESPKLSPAEKKRREAELKKQQAELEKQEAARKQREQDLRDAESALERAAAAESQARAVWERAHDELIAARQRVAEIKKTP